MRNESPHRSPSIFEVIYKTSKPLTIPYYSILFHTIPTISENHHFSEDLRLWQLVQPKKRSPFCGARGAPSPFAEAGGPIVLHRILLLGPRPVSCSVSGCVSHINWPSASGWLQVLQNFFKLQFLSYLSLSKYPNFGFSHQAVSKISQQNWSGIRQPHPWPQARWRPTGIFRAPIIWRSDLQNLGVRIWWIHGEIISDWFILKQIYIYICYTYIHIIYIYIM